MELDKRLYPRSKVRWPVTMTTSIGTIKGETLDVSTLGAYIQCQEPLNPSENFLLSVSLPAGSPLRVFAEVYGQIQPASRARTGRLGWGFVFYGDRRTHSS